jgi:hypothetical protein
MAELVPCLVALRSEFNATFPGRDRRSDGWIGDPAHQARDSDHNPDARGLVHAIDVDADLSAMADMQTFVDHIVARCRSGAERRLTYVIYNHRIASASRGWIWRAYDGDNPHTAHAHLSASDTPARENDTRSWHLEEVPVALTAADKDWIADRIDRGIRNALDDIAVAAGRGVHNQRLGRSDTTIGQAIQETNYKVDQLAAESAGRVSTPG